MSGGGFDRLPTRRPAVPGGHRRAPDDGSTAEAGEPIDQEGKRALFSAEPATAEGSEPAFGAVTFRCSACGAETVQSATQALRNLLPSLHLPILRRRYPSWARCPACGKRTWLRLSVRL